MRAKGTIKGIIIESDKNVEPHKGTNGLFMKICVPLIVIMVVFTLVLIIPTKQFSSVVAHVSRDSRNPTPITYACPNFTQSTGWHIHEYWWRRHGIIVWSQVEHFLTSLEYYNKSVYRCDFYEEYPDGCCWQLFLWFQVGEYEYVFLYAN